jgi:zona occludens toxin
MIHLITGAPGAGKTLYTLDYVRRLAVKEGRPVFYSGIPECTVPGWEEVEAEEWFNCPAGAIIVIDECQRVFRPRANGSKVPEHVERLETHRHNGHDLYLITQHPMLADGNVRRLVGCHRHVQRTFGLNKAVIHEWQSAKEQCEKNRAGSVRSEFFYSKEAMQMYKSAELHTHKARIPARVFILAAIVLIVPLLMWYAYSSIGEKAEAEKTGRQAALPQSFKSSGASVPASRPVGSRQPQTLGEYIAQRTPRFPDFPQTAPVYDDVTKPVTAPYPAGCVFIRNECRCYSQQGTRISTGRDACLEIVERGYFVDFDTSKGQRADVAERAQPEKLAAVDVSDVAGGHRFGIEAGGLNSGGELAPSPLTAKR